MHIVAHSFGGLLSRTYIQGFALDRPYKDNVQSLATLSTPHSGIFDEAGTYYGVAFPKGQDSFSFEGCLQSACNQAGEQTKHIWSVPKVNTHPRDFPYLCMEKDHKDTPQCVEAFNSLTTLDISSHLGVNKDPGERVADLAKDARAHGFPVDVRVLMGLTIDRVFMALLARNPEEYANVGPDLYQSGDELISYAGQKFFPALADIATSDAPVYASGDISITEKILGAPHGTFPLTGVSVDDAFRADGVRIDFEGYRHSNSNMGQGAWGLSTSRGDVGVAYVADADNLSDTGTPHEALTEVKQWLRNHSSEASMPELITLRLQIVDGETGSPIPANVEIGMNQASVSLAAGFTDVNGHVSLTVPFYPLASYTAVVSAEGYHADLFDTGYKTGVTVAASSPEFGRIALQADEVATGTLGGHVIDAVTGQTLSDVNITIKRNGIERTTVSDGNGSYTMPDLVRGSYAVEFSKLGFTDTTLYFDVQPNRTNSGNASLRRVLAEGTMSIRLTWDVDPRDLDSHLAKYAAGSRMYHIYYSDKSDSATGDNLDLDDTSSYGPETTTIQSVDPTARYVFAVHRYSGSGSITSTSNANITIDYGNNLPIVLPAPTFGVGDWWKAFEINNGVVEPCRENCIMSDSDAAISASRFISGNPSMPGPDWLAPMQEEVNHVTK